MTNRYRPVWAPDNIDIETPSAARMYDYELLDPGLVDVIDWRPDPQSPPDPLGGGVTRYSRYGAVGRKR
jgi:hypothetical protein